MNSDKQCVNSGPCEVTVHTQKKKKKRKKRKKEKKKENVERKTQH